MSGSDASRRDAEPRRHVRRPSLAWPSDPTEARRALSTLQRLGYAAVCWSHEVAERLGPAHACPITPLPEPGDGGAADSSFTRRVRQHTRLTLHVEETAHLPPSRRATRCAPTRSSPSCRTPRRCWRRCSSRRSRPDRRDIAAVVLDRLFGAVLRHGLVAAPSIAGSRSSVLFGGAARRPLAPPLCERRAARAAAAPRHARAEAGLVLSSGADDAAPSIARRRRQPRRSSARHARADGPAPRGGRCIRRGFHAAGCRQLPDAKAPAPRKRSPRPIARRAAAAAACRRLQASARVRLIRGARACAERGAGAAMPVPDDARRRTALRHHLHRPPGSSRRPLAHFGVCSGRHSRVGRAAVGRQGERRAAHRHIGTAAPTSSPRARPARANRGGVERRRTACRPRSS